MTGVHFMSGVNDTPMAPSAGESNVSPVPVPPPEDDATVKEKVLELALLLEFFATTRQKYVAPAVNVPGFTDVAVTVPKRAGEDDVPKYTS